MSKETITAVYSDISGMIQNREMLISWIRGLGPLDHEFIITIEETGEEIGECSLTEQRTSGEIGFMILPRFWRRCYGTEMLHIQVPLGAPFAAGNMPQTGTYQHQGMVVKKKALYFPANQRRI